MFTKTSDCRAISDIKYSNMEKNLLPSVQFKLKIDGEDSELMIVAFDIAKPTTRFVLELLYLSGVGAVEDDYLMYVVTNRIPNVDEHKELFMEMTKLRQREIPTEISLNLEKDILIQLLGILEGKGNLSFVIGTQLEHTYSVDSFDSVNDAMMYEILGETLDDHYINLSKPHETLGLQQNFIYPEDWFINSGHRYLEYLDTMSGGNYFQYRTLKQAYSQDPYFSANPDLFNQTYCSCGSELVVRRKDGQFTLMSCTNHFCYEKYGFVLAEFAQKLGIVGLGPGKFNDMCKAIALNNIATFGDGTVNFRLLLKRENEVYFGLAGKELWYDFLDAIENYSGTLSDLIEIMSLPYLSSIASKILTADILKDNTVGPPELLHKSQQMGKQDIKYVLSLWLYLDDIRFVALELTKKLNLNLVDELPIYITEGIELEMDDGTKQRFKKSEFIDLVNQVIVDNGNTTTKVKLKKSLTRECVALIADKSRNTGSCERAMNYGVPIVTSREFLKELGRGGKSSE